MKITRIKVSEEKLNAMAAKIRSTLTSKDGYVYPIEEVRNSGYIVQSHLITFTAPNGDTYLYSPLCKDNAMAKEV